MAQSFAAHVEAARLEVGVPLTIEESTRFFETRASELAGNEEYMRRHPEIQQLVHDFVAALLEDKPDNVPEYARKFFGRFAGIAGARAAVAPAPEAHK